MIIFFLKFVNSPFTFMFVGDKSEVVDVENPDLNRYPKFAEATQYRCCLLPGDVLYIPGMFNCTLTHFICVYSQACTELAMLVFLSGSTVKNTCNIHITHATKFTSHASILRLAQSLHSHFHVVKLYEICFIHVSVLVSICRLAH